MNRQGEATPVDAMSATNLELELDCERSENAELRAKIHWLTKHREINERGLHETDRWWGAFCSAPKIYPAGLETASKCADFADAAIAEARKRGRLP
jgi:hypothetical protein